MSQTTQHIVIVGGGSSGWLTANIIAAEFDPDAGIEVTLVESPSTPTVGVGEGTWPSMRSTLLKIGITETEFIETCSATLKQGTRFEGWRSDNTEAYYHPFTLPHGYADVNLAEYWNAGILGESSFAASVTPQYATCEAGLAPKQIQVPEYAYTLNYGYHLDAAKFAELLRKNAVDRLGVRHIQADVSAVSSSAEGDITALTTNAGSIKGDLFLDCSGFSSLLIGAHFGIPLSSQGNVLFNDSALAVQVPYCDAKEKIATTTLATAHQAGWFWDIGLQHRRGVGAVFSSRHTDRERMENALDDYLRASGYQSGLAGHSARLIEFEPGYRQQFWHRNCVAVGLSAGFIEPLEASALVLVELSARRVAERLPIIKTNMRAVADEFNREFTDRWGQIIEFLKLHYVLSDRTDSAYWIDHRRTASIPATLQEKLDDWRYRCPWHQDERRVDEMFPTASYQYVLYGMGFNSEVDPSVYRDALIRAQRARDLHEEVHRQSERFSAHLPKHRLLLEQVSAQGFSQRQPR